MSGEAKLAFPAWRRRRPIAKRTDPMMRRSETPKRIRRMRVLAAEIATSPGRGTRRPLRCTRRSAFPVSASSKVWQRRSKRPKPVATRLRRPREIATASPKTPRFDASVTSPDLTNAQWREELSSLAPNAVGRIDRLSTDACSRRSAKKRPSRAVRDSPLS